MISLLASLFAALFGLAFGSFLNVCLSRWPAGESVVKPRSHCRACHRTLTWWENIPLLSWLLLRGRCRTCKQPIPCRYPLVEAAVGLLWGLAFGQFVAWLLGDAPQDVVAVHAVQCLASMILLWLLVALASLDAEHLWLPDWLTIPGAILGLAAEGLRVWLQASAQTSDTPIPSPFAALAVRTLEALGVAALILLIRWVYQLIRKREGLGMGDAKLMALLTAWLGLPGAMLSFVVGVSLGTLAALLVLLKPRHEGESWAQMKLPLGTFLCAGGIVSALWGQSIIDLYMRWAGL
jgi:leader peptidase (prepilin peptidase)/N-methyltransferase